MERAGIDPAAVEDVIMGCANPEGATGFNIARQIALRAGCPVTTSGMTVNRYCSSGLQTIALAAQRIIAGEGEVYVAGGVESISCVQNEHINNFMAKEAWLDEHKPAIYWTMLQTAETVAKPLQDSARSAGSLRRAEPAARRRGAGGGPVQRRRSRRSKWSWAPPTGTPAGSMTRTVTVSADEGIRADTNYEAVSKIRAATPGGVIAAGNASQFSDGASACVVMSAARAEKLGSKPLGIFRGFAVAGCEPDEMGIGPVFAIPKLLERAGKTVADIDLWELNEAFAVQVIYCADKLGIPERPAQRERRRDRAGSSLRHDGRAADGPRADRRQAARRETRRGHHVYRRRHGRRGVVRGLRSHAQERHRA